MGTWHYYRDGPLFPASTNGPIANRRASGPHQGYPCQPDHSEKLTLWRLMNVREDVGIELTDTLAMRPAASVCGLYLAHPQAAYFAVEDYASRKGTTVEEIRKWLGPIMDTD
ncbi:hypothetical protein MTO96_049346 [Rhipicephalus appendiculatus]